MNRKKVIVSQYQQRGFSLVELMVAITLSLVLTLGVIEIFISSKQTNRAQGALGNLQENARFALDILSYDIRMAGNIGCNRAAAVTNVSATTNLPNIGNGIQGYEYGMLPAILLLDDSGSPSKNPGQTNVVNGTDTLVIRYASPNTLEVASATTDSVTLTLNSLSVNIDKAPDSVTLKDDNTYAKNTLYAGAPFIISDCKNVDVFIADAITVIDNKTIKITTAQTFSNAYGSDAEVAELKYVAYYIRKFKGDDGITRNNLYRSVVTKGGILNDNIDPDPLLEGIEDMQILYGEDLNGNGSSIRYVTADVANMDLVTSVRISLLLSTIDNNLASGDQNYWFDGELINVAAADNKNKKLYRGFTTTIQLRN